MKLFFKLLWSFWSRREDWLKLLDEGCVVPPDEEPDFSTDQPKNRTMWGD